MECLSGWKNAYGRHSSSLVDSQAFTHHFFGAEQVGFEYQLIRDQRDCGFALPLQPEILNAQRQLRVSCPLEHLIVEVVFARSHRSQ